EQPAPVCVRHECSSPKRLPGGANQPRVEASPSGAHRLGKGLSGRTHSSEKCWMVVPFLRTAIKMPGDPFAEDSRWPQPVRGVRATAVRVPHLTLGGHVHENAAALVAPCLCGRSAAVPTWDGAGR